MGLRGRMCLRVATLSGGYYGYQGAPNQRSRALGVSYCSGCDRDPTGKPLPEGVPLLPLHLWLHIPPCQSVHSTVWWVVCLRVLGIMPQAAVS